MLGAEGGGVELEIVIGGKLQGDILAVTLAMVIVATPVGTAGYPYGVSGFDIFTGEVGAGIDIVGAAGQVGSRQVDQETKLADSGLPAVAEQRGILAVGLFDLIPVVAFGGSTEYLPIAVERHTGAQVDHSAETAFNHVGRRALVGIDAGHQFCRHVVEAQAATTVCGKHIAAIQLTAHLRQAANGNTRTFTGEVFRVAHVVIAGHRHTRHPLQRLGDTAVRQLADIRGDNGIDNLVRIALDVLRGEDTGALAGYLDLLHAFGFAVLVLRRFLCQCYRAQRHQGNPGGDANVVRQLISGEPLFIVIHLSSPIYVVDFLPL